MIVLDLVIVFSFYFLLVKFINGNNNNLFLVFGTFGSGCLQSLGYSEGFQKAEFALVKRRGCFCSIFTRVGISRKREFRTLESGSGIILEALQIYALVSEPLANVSTK